MVGVTESNVNLATEKLVIRYDPQLVTVSDVIRVVANAGYEAREDQESADSQDTEKEKKLKKIQSMWNRFVGSAIFTIPLLYVAMGHMIGLALPMALHPTMNPELFAVLQLMMTIPVMLFGWKFFSVGFKTLFRGHPNMDSLVALGTSV